MLGKGILKVIRPVYQTQQKSIMTDVIGKKRLFVQIIYHYWKASSEINFVFQWKSNGLALVFCILQYLAMTWYVCCVIIQKYFVRIQCNDRPRHHLQCIFGHIKPVLLFMQLPHLLCGSNIKNDSLFLVFLCSKTSQKHLLCQ